MHLQIIAQRGCMRNGRPPLVAFAVVILLALNCASTSMALAAEPRDRPTIALVLGGGGARGGAHIGVIQTLEKYRVPVDIVVGTSMGSIVGGLYASGYSPEALIDLTNKIPWDTLFVDAPPRKDMSFRRKRDDEGFLVKAQLGIGRDGLRLPKGVLTGQKMKLILKRATLHVAQIHDFDELPIPFRAVATDIGRGRFVAFDHGDLAECMSASMAVPLVLSPVTIDGTMYVDGGVTNNLPVDVARRMGADVIIAVDVGTPLAKPDSLKSLLDITGQLTRMLTNSNSDERERMLRPSDILIKPKLGDISSSDFGKVLKTVGLGREAAELHAQALSRLGLSEEAFAAHVAPIRRTPIDAVSTHEIAVARGRVSKVEDKYLLRTMRIPSEERLPVGTLEQGIGRVYGLGLFDEVSYEALEEGVDVEPRLKSWGPNFVRTGVNVAGDFSGRTKFSLGASVTMTQLNLPGAELRSELELGTDARIFSELYQPLRPLGGVFIAPSVEFRAFNFDSYENADLLAEYRVRTFDATMALGRVLSNWGEMRIGITRGKAQSERIVGEPSTSAVDDDLGLVFYRFLVDTLDNRYFPGSGTSTSFQWAKSKKRLGAGRDYAAINFNSLVAVSAARNHVILGAKGGSIYNGDAAPVQSYKLGGFLNLSGLAPDELIGQQMVLGRAILLRQMQKSLFLPAYLGMSFEAGQVWQRQDDIAFGDLRVAGSVFIGFDTILGPLYFGGGWAEHGDRAAYLRLGETF